MQEAFGALLTLVVFAVVIGFMAMLAGGFGLMATLFYKGTKGLSFGENDTINLVYPVAKTKIRPLKEVMASYEPTDSAPAKSSSFFEDVDGVDLEYRGLGVAEDRRAAAAVKKNV